MRKGIITAGVLFAGILAYGYARNPSWLRGGAKQDSLPTLRAGRATLTESTIAIGTVKPKTGAEVKVGSQISGVVAELKVNIGDTVSRGQILALLDSTEWRARVAALKADLASAVAEEEYARNELARFERLQDLTPPLQIENTRRNVKVKEAAVARTRASLAQAETQLGYTVIRAPVAGTIASVSTYQGETVAASFSAPTFVTIVDLKRLEVQSYVDETDIGKVHAGQRVGIRVDAYPGQELAGIVQAIYPKAQLINNVVNYVVIIDIVNAAGLLIRPEMTAHVTFILEQKEGVVSIPRKALLREGGQTLVVVQQGDQWRERSVKVGLQTPESVEIVSGLREGETIVADKQAWKDHLEKSSHD
jgi:RND family efflux transporter MFP subunit